MSASSPAVVPGSGWGQGSGVRGQAARSTDVPGLQLFKFLNCFLSFLLSPHHSYCDCLLLMLVGASIYLSTYLFIYWQNLKFIYC